MTTVNYQGQIYDVEIINRKVDELITTPGTTTVMVWNGIDGHPTQYLTAGNQRIARVYTRNRNFAQMTAPPGSVVVNKFSRK